ncbi:hypothetical protein HOA92_05700 [archaeon]|nr:hypothetical protein [archaeon]MBT6762506.1 hypothetical protein [archaeon]
MINKQKLLEEAIEEEFFGEALAANATDAEFNAEYFSENDLYTLSQKLAHGISEKGHELLDLAKDPVGFCKKVYQEALKEGPYFAAYAVALELTEDVVAPAILTAAGYPEYAPVLWAIHTEPVMYPLYFAVRKGYRALESSLDYNFDELQFEKGDIVTSRYGVIG